MPERVSELTVTAAVPLEVSVTGKVEVEPSVTLPKLRLPGLTVNCGVVPVPLMLTVTVGLVEELLLMVRVPVAEPAVVGSNWTCRVAVWLGFSVKGKVAPETVKPVPEMLSELTVTAAVPLEVRVT